MLCMLWSGTAGDARFRSSESGVALGLGVFLVVDAYRGLLESGLYWLCSKCLVLTEKKVRFLDQRRLFNCIGL